MDAPRIVPDGIDMGRPHAGAGVRLVAFLIDLLLFIGLAEGAILSYHFRLELTRAILGNPPFLGIVLDWCALLFPFHYFTLMECSPLQGTLGKYFLGIKVTDLDGGRISPLRAAGRTLSWLFCLYLFPVWIANVTLMDVEKRQALHDLMSGCLVMQRDKESAEAAGDPDVGTPAPMIHPEGITARGGARDGVDGRPGASASPPPRP